MIEEGTAGLPAAVTKAYDVLLWLINHVGKFPPFDKLRANGKLFANIGILRSC
jgi:hypothetical protein